MRYLLVIILIIGILTSSLNKLIVYTYYQLNTEQITLKYCENKSKPSLKCKGKCHLKKLLKEQESKEQNSKGNVIATDELQLFSECVNSSFISNLSAITIPVKLWVINFELNTYSQTIFHPPHVMGCYSL